MVESILNRETPATELVSRLQNDAAAWIFLKKVRSSLGFSSSPDDFKIFQEGFSQWQKKVRSSFQVPETSFTPRMERYLYGISQVTSSSHVLVLGSYVGYGAAFLGADAHLMPSATGKVTCCDTSQEACHLFAKNVERLAPQRTFEILERDACEVVKGSAPVDVLFLDVDCPERGKRLYEKLLADVWARLNPGALILAHDILVPKFKTELKSLRADFQDFQRYEWSDTVALDQCGMGVARVR